MLTNELQFDAFTRACGIMGNKNKKCEVDVLEAMIKFAFYAPLENA